MKKIILPLLLMVITMFATTSFAWNATPFRSLNQLYQNFTGMTLEVTVVGKTAPRRISSMRGYVDRRTFAVESMLAAHPYVWEFRTIYLIVPPYSTYKVTAGSPYTQLYSWQEEPQ